MDFIRFINSRDIRDHLKKTGYTFRGPEAAYAVYRSRETTLKEKFDAWTHMIETMPDCYISSPFIGYKGGFHDFLRSYMDLKRTTMDRFCSNDGGIYAVYSWDYFMGRLFSSYDNLFDWLRGYLAKYDDEEERAMVRERIKVKKLYIDDREDRPREINIRINEQMEIMSAEEEPLNGRNLDIDTVFDEMAVKIPTPFSRGDIVIEKGTEKPFVLDYLKIWEEKELLENGFNWSDFPIKYIATRRQKGKKRKNCLNSGYMVAYGYEHSPNQDIPAMWYDDFFAATNYLDLEFYRGEMTGKNRFLQVVSAFVKGRISAEVLCNSAVLIEKEEQAEEWRDFFTRMYDRQLLEELDIIPEKG